MLSANNRSSTIDEILAVIPHADRDELSHLDDNELLVMIQKEMCALVPALQDMSEDEIGSNQAKIMTQCSQFCHATEKTKSELLRDIQKMEAQNQFLRRQVQMLQQVEDESNAAGSLVDGPCDQPPMADGASRLGQRFGPRIRGGTRGSAPRPYASKARILGRSPTKVTPPFPGQIISWRGQTQQPTRYRLSPVPAEGFEGAASSSNIRAINTTGISGFTPVFVVPSGGLAPRISPPVLAYQGRASSSATNTVTVTPYGTFGPRNGDIPANSFIGVESSANHASSSAGQMIQIDSFNNFSLANSSTPVESYSPRLLGVQTRPVNPAPELLLRPSQGYIGNVQGRTHNPGPSALPGPLDIRGRGDHRYQSTAQRRGRLIRRTARGRPIGRSVTNSRGMPARGFHFSHH